MIYPYLCSFVTVTIFFLSHVFFLTGREADREVNSLSDGGIGCSVQESELEWRYGIRMKGVFINEGGIYETVRRAGVYKHREGWSIITFERDRGHK